MSSNVTESSMTSYKDFTEYTVAEKIWIVVSPILIVIGTISNILSVVVLARKRMRNSTTMFYLMILALGDILVLSTGLLRYWLKFAFDVDVRLLSQFGCKLHVFLVYFSLDFTTWILVAVTIDRCIFVCLPFRAKQLCTMKHAEAAAISIAILMVAINFHLFWGVEIKLEDGERSCSQANEFTSRVWPWLDFCIFSILPFTVMIICNTCIIRRLIQSHRRIVSHQDRHQERPTQTVSGNGITTPGHEESAPPVVNNHKTKAKVPSVTAMLLSVNCVFLLLTVPIVIYLIVHSYVNSTLSAHERAVTQLFWAIVNMLQYANNSIHFFMYCLTCPRFRKELYRLFNKRSNDTSRNDKSVTLELN
ncbi:hypothetical protein FSP39_008421 [Pinctada imbricata]|uniref:G-protein coupled receptors family 1 profile domain-containing protein n=1 Tax=Pinctada imbricata TaxID=66713 RepID=A0AA89BT97_PINIB|nr:hypothetical protein FSP39_008421 [Pinctada imbricata]